ncbi:hypothetical protein K0M31_010550 [Melipona bicolor]|uniref:Uncharacterized protein n=1 Tax=Melipona bicolor TaxID=60889 RepID=A0AA40FLQ3_9HYME|nr:hypothetical protein K0M31_010550 [Melipona bicolor]
MVPEAGENHAGSPGREKPRLAAARSLPVAPVGPRDPRPESPLNEARRRTRRRKKQMKEAGGEQRPPGTGCDVVTRTSK